jgi:hypothetical protein
VPGTTTAVICLSHTVSTAGQSVFKHDTFPSGTEIITQNYLCLVPCNIFTVATSFVRFYVICAAVSEVFHNLYNFNKHNQISINIYRNDKCRCSFYCALFTLHVSAPIGGHLHVICNTKNSKAVTVYVNG